MKLRLRDVKSSVCGHTAVKWLDQNVHTEGPTPKCLIHSNLYTPLSEKEPSGWFFCLQNVSAALNYALHPASPSLPYPPHLTPFIYRLLSHQDWARSLFLNSVCVIWCVPRNTLLIWSWREQSTDSNDLGESGQQCGVGHWGKRDPFDSSTVTAEHWI